MPKPPNAIRLVPKNPEPFEETLALVERLGWEKSEDSGDDVVEWNASGAKTVVRWVVDGDTGVQFFVVEGPDRQKAAKQIEDGIEMLHVDDFEDYLARFHGTQGLARGLYTVAAAAPEQADPRVLELFDRCMNHDDPLVRRAALLATGITQWPEFVERVSRFRDDPDPAVQRAAEAAMRGLATSD